MSKFIQTQMLWNRYQMIVFVSSPTISHRTDPPRTSVGQLYLCLGKLLRKTYQFEPFLSSQRKQMSRYVLQGAPHHKSKHRIALIYCELSAARSKTCRWTQYRPLSFLLPLTSQLWCPKHIGWCIRVSWAQLQSALFRLQRQWFWSDPLPCLGKLL